MQKASLIVDPDLESSTRNSLLALKLFSTNKCITFDCFIETYTKQTQPKDIG